jgi:hypothetical protein
MTKPEPSAWLRRGRVRTLLAVEEIVEEILQRAARGHVRRGPWRLATTADVVMLTTASPTWSTRSAKDGGAACARACVVVTTIAIATRSAIMAAISGAVGF